MRFVFVHSDHPDDNFRVHIRVRNAAEAIQRAGIHRTCLLAIKSFVSNTPEAARICQDADVIIIHRYLYGPVLERVQYWKAREKKVVVDFDQPLDYLTSELPGYQFWMQTQECNAHAASNASAITHIPPAPVEQFRWGLRLVDKACVPSARLADDWSEHTRIVILPDYINTDQYLVVPRKESPIIQIGVECSGMSLDLLEEIGFIYALNNVCQGYDNLHVHFMNLSLAGDCQIPMPEGKFSLCKSISLEDWPGFLSNMDIGLLPVGGMYALRSSWLRALEFMALKIPWLASDLPPYRDVGRFGLLVQHGERYWQSALIEVLSKLDYYHNEAAGEPFLFALSQDIQENVDKIVSVFLDA